MENLNVILEKKIISIIWDNDFQDEDDYSTRFNDISQAISFFKETIKKDFFYDEEIYLTTTVSKEFYFTEKGSNEPIEFKIEHLIFFEKINEDEDILSIGKSEIKVSLNCKNISSETVKELKQIIEKEIDNTKKEELKWDIFKLSAITKGHFTRKKPNPIITLDSGTKNILNFLEKEPLLEEEKIEEIYFSIISKNVDFRYDRNKSYQELSIYLPSANGQMILKKFEEKGLLSPNREKNQLLFVFPFSNIKNEDNLETVNNCFFKKEKILEELTKHKIFFIQK